MGRFFYQCQRMLGLVCALLLCEMPEAAMAQKAQAPDQRPRILYYNSATPEDHWWHTTSEIMQAACDDLGLELEVVYVNRNHIGMLEHFESVINGSLRPDAVVFQSLKKNGVGMLKLAEQGKIPAFMFNAGLTAEQTRSHGGPRERFKYWIGQMLPDDQAAGHDLALTLYREALSRGLVDHAGKVQFLAINGAVADGAAIERAAGLQLAMQQEPGIALQQLTSANWQREQGKLVFLGLSRRYPQAKAVWAANDPMGLGALDGMLERGLVPGKDMLVGSIDWVPEALHEVANNRLVTTQGGHFMEAGWVMVLLHDYFKQRDFASEAVSFKTKMTALSQRDSAAYLRAFTPENFHKINFRQFSKAENPALQQYNFSFAPVLADLLDQE
ncbi:ABC transporter substrate-binding protein [Pseudomonas sp. CAU 1711]|uniref:ABC transporter substrate-binding protein n=1 Tax=Pseudomonas sp. CAU 1711 TaxID=3140356 RepID=UPI0032610763